MIYLSVVSFALGIVFEKYLHLGWSFAILVFIVSLFSFLTLFQTSEKARPFLMIGFAFGFGILRMFLADTSPDPFLLKSVGEKISFEATVIEDPDVRDTSTRYTVKNEFDSLILLIAPRFPEFEYGDKILVSGKLDLPKNFLSEGGIEFDYISYLSKDRIHFLVYQPVIQKIDSGQGNKVISFLYSIKNKFIKNISNVVPEPNASLLGGIIFGAKQSLGEDLLTDFKNVGLIHIIVLSGYNLTIIVSGILYTASYFGKRKIGFIASVFILILFSLMVGLGATVIRAAIMAMIAILAKYLGRPNEALRALFVAGFLMLSWNPLLLTQDPSFQLSFMATLGLVLFSPILENFISKNKFQRFIPTKGGLREIFASTFAVQIFLLPLLIKMSGTFSIISFLVNLLVLPLIPTVMILGFVTGLLGFLPIIGQFVSWPFGALSYIFSQIIISIAELSADLPLAFIQTGTIPIWLIGLWYSAYAFIFYKLKKSNLFSR